MGLPLPRIMAGENQVWRQQEFPMADAPWGWQCKIVIVDTLGFTLHLGELKGSLYLPGELPEVIDPWDPH